jgi:hypothetical protein
VHIEPQVGGNGFDFVFFETNIAGMAATVTATQTLEVHQVSLR